MYIYQTASFPIGCQGHEGGCLPAFILLLNIVYNYFMGAPSNYFYLKNYMLQDLLSYVNRGNIL